MQTIKISSRGCPTLTNFNLSAVNLKFSMLHFGKYPACWFQTNGSCSHQGSTTGHSRSNQQTSILTIELLTSAAFLLFFSSFFATRQCQLFEPPLCHFPVDIFSCFSDISGVPQLNIIEYLRIICIRRVLQLSQFFNQ